MYKNHKYRYNPRMLRKRQYIVALGDLVVWSVSLVLMLILRFGSHYHAGIVGAHVRAFVLIFLVWLIIFFIFNLYDMRMINPSPRTIGRLGLAMFIAVLISVLFFYVNTTFGIAPRLNLAIVGGLALVGMIAWRRVAYRIFAKLLRRNIMIIGNHPEAVLLEKQIKQNPFVGRICYRAENVDGAILYKKESAETIDLVIIEPEDPGSIALIARTFDTTILTLVGAYEELFGRIPLSLMTDELAREIAAKTARHSYAVVSRILEIIISLTVLIITSPLIAIAAIAKKMEDGGQIILRPHTRLGKDGIVFQCHKIRTMVLDAEKDGVQWTAERDPRITRVGHILRKLHIDELPQFWNIFKGDMALVGPRPERPEFVEKLEKEIPYYYLRRQVTPGFTGWAQIKFRYARTVLDAQEKLEYDLYYAKNRSLLLDIGILLKTIQIIFTH